MLLSDYVIFAFTSMTGQQVSFHAPGLVLFLEEDLYLTKDTLHTLRMLDSQRINEEDMIVMGSRNPIQWASLKNLYDPIFWTFFS